MTCLAKAWQVTRWDWFILEHCLTSLFFEISLDFLQQKGLFLPSDKPCDKILAV